MRLQILFFDGCPNHGPTVDLARRVVAESGLDVLIEEIEVNHLDDPTRLRFLGSPTIRVDGTDIDPTSRERTDFGFCCRTYDGRGVPPRTLLEQALLVRHD